MVNNPILLQLNMAIDIARDFKILPENELNSHCLAMAKAMEKDADYLKYNRSGVDPGFIYRHREVLDFTNALHEGVHRKTRENPN